jgi:acyl carrier protein
MVARTRRAVPDSAVPISTQLRQRLADLLAAATDGEVESGEVLTGQFTLPELGVSSLGYLRLIDAVEREFSVELDPDRGMSTLDELVAQVEAGS